MIQHVCSSKFARLTKPKNVRIFVTEHFIFPLGNFCTLEMEWQLTCRTNHFELIRKYWIITFATIRRHTSSWSTFTQVAGVMLQLWGPLSFFIWWNPKSGLVFLQGWTVWLVKNVYLLPSTELLIIRQLFDPQFIVVRQLQSKAALMVSSVT